MKASPIISLLCLALVLFSSCKKEDLDIACDENSFTVDQNKIDRKVLVIGIDGFRSDVMNANRSPFLYSYAQDPGTYFTGENIVEYLTLSGPNWTSLLTGAHWEKHMVEDNFFSFYNVEEYPPFFHYIEQAKSSINTVSLCHWLPINSSVNQDFTDYSPISLFSDSAIYADGLSLVEQNYSVDGDIIFLHFDDLDHFGHLNGFHDTIPEYAQAVTTMDGYAMGLVNAVDARRALGEDWIIFIVSDHGGINRGHTGLPNEPAVNQTIFYANHPSETFLSNYISSQTDLAPSILDFLGI
ncbi:MAG: putative AlkP superfamily pyrophosphatase or phosphodiesterase, partial [Chitinophagales bacterium]